MNLKKRLLIDLDSRYAEELNQRFRGVKGMTRKQYIETLVEEDRYKNNKNK